MHSRVNFNGEMIAMSTQMFGLDHAIFNSGIILVERLRLFQGEVMFLERHYFHLMAQMRMARMKIPMSFTLDFFLEELLKIKKDSNLENAEFNFYVTQDQEATDFWISSKLVADQIFFNQKYSLDLYRETHVSGDFHQRLNFLNPRHRIFRIYATENDMDDLILLNEKKAIAHSMNGNLFMIQNNQVFTPTIEQGAKDDVLRDRVLQACIRAPEINIVSEEEIFPFKLTHADEIFIAQNGKGILQVTKLRKKDYSNDVTQCIVNSLMNLD